jgi:hypothetical protein
MFSKRSVSTCYKKEHLAKQFIFERHVVVVSTIFQQIIRGLNDTEPHVATTMAVLPLDVTDGKYDCAGEVQQRL